MPDISMYKCKDLPLKKNAPSIPRDHSKREQDLKECVYGIPFSEGSSKSVCLQVP